MPAGTNHRFGCFPVVRRMVCLIQNTSLSTCGALLPALWRNQKTKLHTASSVAIAMARPWHLVANRCPFTYPMEGLNDNLTQRLNIRRQQKRTLPHTCRRSAGPLFMRDRRNHDESTGVGKKISTFALLRPYWDVYQRRDL